MSVLMARIDDRLIHGQVVVSCCGSLRAERIILCDDEIAADAFQSRLYSAAVPEEIAIECLGVAATATRLAELDDSSRARTIVVTGGCEQMASLCEATKLIESVCVGGMHHHEGAIEVWPDFFLTHDELRCLRRVLDRGIEIRIQSVPGATSIDAAERLRADVRP